MKFRHALLFVAVILVARPTVADQASIEDLTIFTEINAPFNYLEQGELTGISVDLLFEVLQRLNVDKTQKDITIVPWARGFNELQHRENSMLFSTARTPEREHNFKWAGPINDIEIVLIARKDREVDLTGDNTFNSYKYGVTKDSISEQLLLSLGVHPDKFVFINSTQSAITLLSRGRIDAWARDITVASWAMKETGHAISDFKVVYAFDAYTRHFAFNKKTDDAIVTRFQKMLDTVIADGTHRAIVEKYTGNLLAAANKNRPNRYGDE